MAWTNLPTDYTDAVWDGMRKYNEITNDDGTVSFLDVTTYTGKEKSFFGAKDANAMNDAINTIMASITDQHPIGSLYISMDSTSPASLFGGTWEQLTSGYLVTAGYSYQKWTYECAENESFTLTESTQCRFGADGYGYIYKTLAAGTYSAVLATFGSYDPAANQKKHVDIFKTITIGAGDTGGEAAHTLEAEELAPHGHVEVSYNSYGDGSISSLVSGKTDILENAVGFRFDLDVISSTAYFPWVQHTQNLRSRNAGGGKAHDNMSPYLGTYIWQRIN